MNSNRQPITASRMVAAISGMMMLLTGIPLLRIPFISFIGLLLVVCALFVLARALDSLADSTVSVGAKVAGTILQLVGGLWILGGMVYATPGWNRIEHDYSWRMFGYSWLTSALITFGIHVRGKLARSQAILIFFFWYLFLPLTFFVVHIYTLMGLDMSGRN